MNTKTASLGTTTESETDGLYAFADFLRPLVMLHAPGFASAPQLLNGLRQIGCQVEELPREADIPSLLRNRRPTILVVGPWATDSALNVTRAQKIRDVSRSVSCGFFLLYDPGNKASFERVASLAPEEFCPLTEPLELVLLRLKLALESSRAQNRLRLLKRAVDHAENGVLITDAMSKDMPIIYVNPGFERITGYTAQETLGRNCRFLQGDERNQPELDRLRAALSKGEACTVVLKNFRKDHTLFWNRLHVSPVYDEESQLTHYVGVQTDITAEVTAQENLRESEERFRVMADSAPVMMWMMNRAQEWFFFNKAWLEFLGLEEEEHNRWLELVRPADQIGLKRLLDGVLRQPRPFRWEGEIQTTDEQYRPIVLSGVPRYDNQGELVGFVGSALDITDKKNFERAIARRQRTLAAQGLMQRKLLASVPGGDAERDVLNILAEVTDVTSASIWKLDEVEQISGQISLMEISTVRRGKQSLRLNRESSQLWPRLHIGEIITISLDELKGAERDFFLDRQSAFVLLAPVLSRGHLRSVLVLESKEDEFTWDSMYSDLVQAAVAAFTVAQTQADSEQEMSRLAAFPKLSPNPFVILTRDCRLSENVAAREFVQSCNLQSVDELLPEHFTDLVQYCLESDRAHQIVTAIGKETRLNWTFVPLRDEEVVLAYGADISHLVALEQRLVQSQKMEALGELTSSIGHEFNNLLSAIQGAVDLIAIQPGLSPALMEQVRQISWESEKGAALARHLFLYGKVGSIERQVVDLNEVVAGMSDILDRILGNGMTRRLDLEHGLPPIQGDRAMIEQTIYNLVLNAREATKGMGSVTVSTCLIMPQDVTVQMAKPSPEGYLRLSVSDCGVGMTAEETARIFEPLYTTKNSMEHSGLGLFVVYSIVKEHEGWIELSSVPNVGTTFQIYFPTVSRSEEAPKRLAPLDEDKVGTILLVEDNVAVARNTSKLLSNHGHTVYLAHTGEEAIKLWDAHEAEIDLVLCDVVIDHNYNGPDLAKKLKNRKASVKIVLTSGYSREFAIQSFGLSAESHFIPKPFTSSELTTTIQAAME